MILSKHNDVETVERKKPTKANVLFILYKVCFERKVKDQVVVEGELLDYFYFWWRQGSDLLCRTRGGGDWQGAGQDRRGVINESLSQS